MENTEALLSPPGVVQQQRSHQDQTSKHKKFTRISTVTSEELKASPAQLHIFVFSMRKTLNNSVVVNREATSLQKENPHLQFAQGQVDKKDTDNDTTTHGR